MAENIDDDFNPRVSRSEPVAKPSSPAGIKCYICSRVGNWTNMQSPSYLAKCFECDVARGVKNIIIDEYRNDTRCSVVKDGVQCGRSGCQRWTFSYPVCTTCNPPPKPARKRTPLTISFKAAWMSSDIKIPDRNTSNLGRLNVIIADMLSLEPSGDISKIESAIVQRNDTGDAKVITNFAVTTADLWEDSPAKITMILHKRKG